MSKATKTRAAVIEAAAALRAGTPKSAASQRQMKAALRLDEALDDIEWTERGLAEWREAALSNGKSVEAARAVARIAIGHLQAVLAEAAVVGQTPAQASARLWLASVGSEPT